MFNKSRKWIGFASLVVTAAVLAGCGRHESTSGHQAASEAGVGVTLLTVRNQRLPEYADFPGTVNAADRVQVASRIMGYVKTLKVHEGQTVHAGQLLLTIDPTQVKNGIAQARANLDKAEAALANAAANQRRYKALYDQKAIPAQQYQQVHMAYQVAQGSVAAARAALSSARQQLQYAEVRAPFEGIVVAKSVSQGQLAAPGQRLLTLDSAAHLQVVTQLSDQAFGGLKLGEGVEVKVNGLDTQPLTLKGVVERLVSASDPVTHTHTVKLALPAHSQVPSGAYARVRVVVGYHNGILIPRSSVHERGGIEGVFVADRHQIAHFRMIRLGQSMGDQVQVLAGLVGGEHVVISARKALDNGVSVKVDARS